MGGDLQEVAKPGKFPSERRSEILGVVLLGFTALLFLALVTDDYHHQGQARRYLDGMSEVPNLLGRPGAMLAGVFTLLVGDAAHVLYGLTFIWGLMLLSHRPVDRIVTRLVGMLILACAAAGLLQVDVVRGASNVQPGGAFGAFVADRLLVPHFGVIGSNVVGITFLAIGILLATDFLFIHLMLVVKTFLLHLFRGNLVIYETVMAFLEKHRESARKRALAIRAAALPSGKASAPELPRSGPAVHLSSYMPTADSPKGGKAKPEPALPKAAPPRPPQEQELPFNAVPDLGADVFPNLRTPNIEHARDEELPKPQVVIADAGPVPSAGQLSLVDGDGSGGAGSQRKTRRPRRKTVVIEDLPADYEYPKRFTKPPIDLLDPPEPRVVTNLDQQLRTTSSLLEETLQTFGIEARVTDITRGPTITRFELEPAPGIKVSRFLALADDIALALKAHRVRVEAPIPGKGRVGIEVPNHVRDQVLIRELLESPVFAKGKGKLSLALGKDIAGDVKVADLASMPHLLVAGATGAGKTVCVKALLASLLIQHTPDDVQLMLIDPKMVELSIFNDIPHLITPVVTDPKKAAAALNWLITEMEERYRLFADLRVRNIEVYNQSVENGEIEMEPGEGETTGQSLNVIRRLPYIVCIIDELADLMMLARAEVEDAIARLAQLARAVGIHLIIATQRPSVDVLTGVIKANFPARLSFQVSSRVDSRCILDEIGAERLIGQGDMLYLPAGQSKPTRIQGAFVSDDEMNGLVAYLKRQAPPQYRDEIENFGKTKDNLEDLLSEDEPLFDDAVRVVLETGQASISMVQRRLRVGYTRAARLIDMMELRGIVGPHTGSKAREILVSAPT
jgi:S-DNA-T family DNA segregation ATPase FtsK/SpoIIIE